MNIALNEVYTFKLNSGEELIAKALHPKRIQQWLEAGMDIEDI